MSAFAHHLILRLQDNRVISPTKSEKLVVIRTILKMASNKKLLAFHLADTHIHILLADKRKESGFFSRSLEIAISNVLKLDISFSPAFIKPIEDNQHLKNTFFYILGQIEHHGIQPLGLHECSSIPDLLGLRVLSLQNQIYVNQFLPRVNDLQIQKLAKWNLSTQIDNYDPLPQAAAAVIGQTSINNKSPFSMICKRAAINLAKDFLKPSETMDLLEISKSAYYRINREIPLNSIYKNAIRGQLQIRQS